MSKISSSVAFTLPQPLEFLQRARSKGLTDVDINRGITNTYEQIGAEMGKLINPQGLKGVRPNWFDVGGAASYAVGEGILAGQVGAEVLQKLQSALTVQGLRNGEDLALVRQLCKDLSCNGLRNELPVIMDVVRSINPAPLADPPVLAVSETRFVKLLLQAPGNCPQAKAEALCKSIEDLFAEGNQDIYADIAPMGVECLKDQGLSPEDFLQRAAKDPAKAQSYLAFGLAHAMDAPPPTDFSKLVASPDEGKDLALTGLALYKEAAATDDVKRKNALVAMGTNFVLFHEQHDVAPRTFTQKAGDGQVDHTELMAALTFSVLSRFGAGKNAYTWKYDDFLNALPTGTKPGVLLALRRFFTRVFQLVMPPILNKNWAVFPDRWPAIMNAMENLYLHPDAMDQVPQVPDPRTAEERGDPVTQTS
jgi:hypothetical protein